MPFPASSCVPSPPSSPCALPLSFDDELAPASLPPDFGADGAEGLLDPLELPELLELLELDGADTHSPCSQVSEQQSPNFVHAAPVPLQVAPVPPQTPLSQSALQHWPFDVHVSPSAEQLGVVGVDDDPEDEDAPEEDDPDDDDALLGAMHTPEQDRLQQSDHSAQTVPSAPHAPPAPPSVDCSQGSVVALAAQPATTAIRVPSATAVAWFMTGLIATDVPRRRDVHLREMLHVLAPATVSSGRPPAIPWLPRDP